MSRQNYPVDPEHDPDNDPQTPVADKLKRQYMNQKGPRTKIGDVLRQRHADSVARSAADAAWVEARIRTLLGVHLNPTAADVRAAENQAKRENKRRQDLRFHEEQTRRREAELRSIRAQDTAAHKLRLLLERVRARGRFETKDRLVWQKLARTVEAAHGITVPTLDDIIDSEDYNLDMLREVRDEDQ